MTSPATFAAGLREVDALLAGGRPREAGERLAPLLHAAPDSPDALRLSGWVALGLGQTADGFDALRRSVELSPDSGWRRVELGRVLARHGQVDEALAELDRALAREPASVDAWYAKGGVLYGAQRDSEAAWALREAVRLSGGHPEIRRALAEAEYGAGEFARALGSFDALAAGPSTPAPIRLRQAQCRRKVGRPSDALAICRAALEEHPADAQLWHELGRCHEDIGDAAAALTCYAKALELRPGWADALGAAIPVGRRDVPASLLGQAEVLCSTASVPDADRAYLHFVLGRHADAAGRFDEAFGHWRRANELRRRLAGGMDRHEFDARIAAVLAAFPSAAASSPAVAAGELVFVVGMPRSGTTLVEQIIAAHPGAVGCGELTALSAQVDALVAQFGAGWTGLPSEIVASALERAAGNYLDAARAVARPGSARLVDKQPYNFFHLGLVERLFAGARVVWCRRDARDVALSIYGENFAPQESYATDLSDIAHVISGQERLMRHWQSVLSLPILEVSYEALVQDIEGQAQRLIAFIGLPWDDRCTRPHEAERTVQTPSRWQVRQPVHTGSVGRWRNYASWFSDAD